MEGAFKNLDFEIYIDLNILYFLISNIEIFPYFTFMLYFNKRFLKLYKQKKHKFSVKINNNLIFNFLFSQNFVNIVKKPLLNKKF